MTLTSDALIGEALAALDPERLVETARLLIDTPSPTGAERHCATRLAHRLDALGIPAVLDPFDDSRANVTASVGRGDGGVEVMVNGHLDTTGYGDERDRAWLVEAGPSDEPRSALVDGILSGLGAYNMKGGLAAAAEAIVALASVADRLSGRATLAAVAGESEKAPVDGLLARFAGLDVAGGGVGSARMLEGGRLRPDAVVICEPSGLAVVNAQPGYVLLRLLVRGRAGYLPPAETSTALDGAAAVLAAVRNWGRGYADWGALDCGLGVLRPTVTVGAIEGGWPFKPGGTPAGVALYVDLRVPPGLDAMDAIASLTDAVRAAAGSAGDFSIEAEPFARHLPGALVPSDHPLIEAARAAVQLATGAPDPVPLDGDFPPGDDGKLFAAAGIPYVKVGPGTPVGRDPRFGREQVRVSELVAAARTYVALAVRLASMPREATHRWPPIGS
jgi:acetylornithine deacetylase/succinyl-diaminopimelate desuccinylase-like protein